MRNPAIPRFAFKVRSGVKHRAAVGVCALVLLAGCAGGGGHEAPADMPALYTSLFEEALANPETSDFARSVLEDYEVTDAELQEARSKFADCLEAWPGGFEWVWLEGGGSDSGPVPDDPAEAAKLDEFVDSCQSPLSSVFMMYDSLTRNPEALTFAQAVRRCFDLRGVPDGKGLPDDEFQALIEPNQGEFVASTPEGDDCTRFPLDKIGTK